jgi:peptidyl-prolyl cis-trans isomerase B (cyclophilin B)
VMELGMKYTYISGDVAHGAAKAPSAPLRPRTSHAKRNQVAPLLRNRQRRRNEHVVARSQNQDRRGTMFGILALAAALQAKGLPAMADDVALPVVTDQVFLEVGVCLDGYRKDRRLGDASILCDDPEPLGTIVIDLFGQAVPDTVYNFKELVRSGALVGSTVNRCFARSFITAGQQGAHRMGLLEVNGKDMVGKLDLRKNSDLLKSSSFQLRHARPGTVSLNLGKNSDDDFYRNRPGYVELGFLITTGPGPVPSLDEENIVFGRVSSGLGVVTRISEVSTFKENKSLQVFTDLATVLGDDRVQKKQGIYGKPLTPVVFTKTGIVGDGSA